MWIWPVVRVGLSPLPGERTLRRSLTGLVDRQRRVGARSAFVVTPLQRTRCGALQEGVCCVLSAAAGEGTEEDLVVRRCRGRTLVLQVVGAADCDIGVVACAPAG